MRRREMAMHKRREGAKGQRRRRYTAFLAKLAERREYTRIHDVSVVYVNMFPFDPLVKRQPRRALESLRDLSVEQYGSKHGGALFFKGDDLKTALGAGVMSSQCTGINVGYLFGWDQLLEQFDIT